MSADSHTVCPRCHPEVLERVGVLPNIGGELGLPNDMRENIDYYQQNLIIDGKSTPQLVFTYRADCWTCDFSFEVTHEFPIPGLEPHAD